MNTMIQVLNEQSGLMGLTTRVLCDEHLAQANSSAFLTLHSSMDECEVCSKVFFEDEKAYRDRQKWLAQIPSLFQGVSPYNLIIYVAGPMTGLPDNNRPAFHRVSRMLSHFGYQVIDPAKLPQDKPYQWLIRQGIHGVLRSNAMVMLTGWHKSPGARVERSIAKLISLPILNEI